MPYSVGTSVTVSDEYVLSYTKKNETVAVLLWELSSRQVKVFMMLSFSTDLTMPHMDFQL